MWKWELQQFADDLDLILDVYHFPPGTSKWNKIEHRLFSVITQNWRGQPLTSHQVIVNLSAPEPMRASSSRPPSTSPASDAEVAQLRVAPYAFHGEWATPSPRPVIRLFAILFRSPIDDVLDEGVYPLTSPFLLDCSCNNQGLLLAAL